MRRRLMLAGPGLGPLAVVRQTLDALDDASAHGALPLTGGVGACTAAKSSSSSSGRGTGSGR